MKPNVPIIRNRYTILDIAPPAGSWALALSSALDTHQSLLTYTPRPAPRGAARGSLSLNFITRVAPHCVNTLMILHAAHTHSSSLIFITRVAPHCVNTLMILHAAHTLIISAC